MKTRNVLIALAAVAVFSVSAFGGVPPGDTCATAVAPKTPMNLCNMSVGLTDPTGFGGYPYCWGGYGQRDAWTAFVATDTQARIQTDLNSVETDTHFMVYEGDCVTPVPIGCSEDEISAGWYGDICVDGLTPGNTYYVQVGTYAVDHDSYGPSYNWCNYYTSLTFAVDVTTKGEAPKTGQICGDGVVNSPCEECDSWGVQGDCEKGFICGEDCKCFSGIPMLPAWGLVGLGLLLAAGGATVFGRRRK